MCHYFTAVIKQSGFRKGLSPFAGGSPEEGRSPSSGRWRHFSPLPLTPEDAATDGKKLARELLGLLFIFVGVLVLLSLVTFSAADPSLNHAVSGLAPVQNGAGMVGAYLSGFLVDFFGISAYFLALGLIWLGLRRMAVTGAVEWWRWLGLVMLGLAVATAGSYGKVEIGDIRGGGMLGNVAVRFLLQYFSPRGTILFWLFIFLVAMQLLLGMSWFNLVRALLVGKGKGDKKKGMPRKKDLRVDYEKKAGAAAPQVAPDRPAKDSLLVRLSRLLPGSVDVPAEGHSLDLNPHSLTCGSPLSLEPGCRNPDELEAGSAAAGVFAERNVLLGGGATIAQADAEVSFSFGTESEEDNEAADKRKASRAAAAVRKKLSPLPSADLLTPPQIMDNAPTDEELTALGKRVIECLADFGIQGKLVGIVPGPVVTMFEIRPAPGVKVSRIAALSDDIALAMRAVAVRVQAPIPGTDTVGIEVPNDLREAVWFKDVVDSAAFKNTASLLTMALGKDTVGRPFVADLAKMPHLLVAGATGAGKSVCLNSILLSFLYRAQPDELKLLLVDPKRIELAVYADLPHLVHPVVTEMSQAKNALDWAVHEMDLRYAAIAQLGVRNCLAYNERLAELQKTDPESVAALKPMPYLVIIIDELADLMLTAAKEVETSIVRLAQLARAAGIHLILATQRPSVDVVTGLIKANFPCRISFQVTSKHDSRTILDTVGAEHLLGKGDMLFKPGGGGMQRLHGAFVTDEDVGKVAGFWKKQMPPNYEVDFSAWEDEVRLNASGGGLPGEDISGDPMYAEAVDFVLSQGKASISLIQRRFKIGFNRAARFVDQMEQDGIVGPSDGSKPRSVIR